MLAVRYLGAPGRAMVREQYIAIRGAMLALERREASLVALPGAWSAARTDELTSLRGALSEMSAVERVMLSELRAIGDPRIADEVIARLSCGRSDTLEQELLYLNGVGRLSDSVRVTVRGLMEKTVDCRISERVRGLVGLRDQGTR